MGGAGLGGVPLAQQAPWTQRTPRVLVVTAVPQGEMAPPCRPEQPSGRPAPLSWPGRCPPLGRPAFLVRPSLNAWTRPVRCPGPLCPSQEPLLDRPGTAPGAWPVCHAQPGEFSQWVTPAPWRPDARPGWARWLCPEQWPPHCSRWRGGGRRAAAWPSAHSIHPFGGDQPLSLAQEGAVGPEGVGVAASRPPLTACSAQLLPRAPPLQQL